MFVYANYAEKFRTVYERAGSSMRVRLLAVVGLVKFVGATFCGVAKLFAALRSVPVRVKQSRVFVGAASSQMISTSRDLFRSRLKRKTEYFPAGLSNVAETST